MDRHPRIELGTWPTPVMHLPHVSKLLEVDVWAKREDLCGVWGGNKVRKLEYILGRARADGIETLVGFGAGTSNWTSALAFHAVPLGFGVEVRLTANETPPAYERLYRQLRTRVVRRNAPRWYLEATLAPRAPGRGRIRYLPLGGSGAEGDLGSLGAGQEIAAAVKSGELPFPRKVFVASGTAGTAAGVAVGAQTDGLGLDVVCVRVTSRPYGTSAHVGVVARSLRRRSRFAGQRRYRLHADAAQAAPGYAQPNPRSREAEDIAALDRLALDLTYGAKAFASLVAAARRGEPGPFLFLHTSPGPPPGSIAG